MIAAIRRFVNSPYGQLLNAGLLIGSGISILQNLQNQLTDDAQQLADKLKDGYAELARVRRLAELARAEVHEAVSAADPCCTPPSDYAFAAAELVEPDTNH